MYTYRNLYGLLEKPSDLERDRKALDRKSQCWLLFDLYRPFRAI